MKRKYNYVVYFGCEHGTIMYCSLYEELPTEDGIQLNKQELIDTLPELNLNINEMFHIIIPFSMLKDNYKIMKKWVFK